MKTSLKLVLLASIFSLFSCEIIDEPEGQNKVLMLQVDYTTNTFEGGREFCFHHQTDSFTMIKEYHSPSDFGSLKFTYSEVNEVLFFGTIIWMGLGEMTIPDSIFPPESFVRYLTTDFVYPANGFENIFDSTETGDYMAAWSSIQNIAKVREYLISNPNQRVKIFLYTPSVGMGDPLDWNWIIYLKN